MWNGAGREGGKQANPGPGLRTAFSLAEESVGTCCWGSSEAGRQAGGEDGTSLHSWAFGSNPPQRTPAKEPL